MIISQIGSITLREARVQTVLDRLYSSAKRDKYRYLQLLPHFLKGLMSGKGIFDVIKIPKIAKNIYLPISRKQGTFLYQTARAIKAKVVVEFGTSFGISTIYLASAIKDNGGGLVIGTELEPNKCEQAIRNLAEAGLDDVTDIRLGDALLTLKETIEPIDMVFIDGWKDLYIPVLKMLQPRLRIGSIVLADNIYTFKRSLRPYVEYVQSAENGFESTTLLIGEGMEYSLYIR